MKNKIAFATPLIIFFLFLFSGTSRAQEPGSIYDTAYSAILKEKRPIQVNLPARYNPDSTARYDVIYVLDGEWNTSLAKTVRGFLEYGKFIPANIIIVGIPNLYLGNDNLRDRDFTPTPVNFMPTSGGAANFLSFLKNDLLPYIDKKYLTNKENNILYGTSLGGLFALYAFFQEPSLFKSYLTVEPSLWWDNGYLNKLAIEKMASLSNVQGTLWISSRDGAAYRDMGIAPLDSILKQHAPKNLDWKVETYPNETHFSAIWKGIYDGYKFSYKGMITEGEFALDPMNGRLVTGKPFSLYCFNMASENYIHYTTDGSEPTKVSPTLKSENRLNFSESTIVTIKSIGARKENDKTIRCQFIIDEKPMAAIPKPKNAKEGGLNYKYYKGDWNQLPDLSKIKPTANGVAGKDFNINKLDPQNGFACLLQGFLEVPKEGYYKVEVNGDHNCNVWIGQQLVIGNSAAQTRRENFIIYLQQGLYPYKITYLHKKGDQPLPPIRWYQQNEGNISPASITFFYSGN